MNPQRSNSRTSSLRFSVVGSTWGLHLGRPTGFTGRITEDGAQQLVIVATSNNAQSINSVPRLRLLGLLGGGVALSLGSRRPVERGGELSRVAPGDQRHEAAGRHENQSRDSERGIDHADAGAGR